MPGPDLFDRAVDLHAAGRLTEADALCRQIVATEPAHYSALLMLGMIQAQTGNFAEALPLIDRSLGLEPDIALGQFYRGLVLAGLGRIDDAVRSYRRAAELDPEFVEAHYNLGHLLAAANRNEEAVRVFGAAVRLAPDLAEALCARAVALSRLSRHAEALADLDAVLARRADFTPALNLRSDLYGELGRHAEALADSERSLAIAPGPAEAHVSRSAALLGLHRREDALTEIELALARDPNSARGLAMRGAINREFGRLAESLADCDRAVALAPNDAVMHFNHGDTLLLLGQHARALAALDQAVALNPRLAKVYASRAMVLRHLHRYEDALADCERALALDPAQGQVASERVLLAGLLCDWRGRAERIADLARRVRAGEAVSPWIVATSIDDPALQLAAARRVSDPSTAATPVTPPHARLRIAWLSPDFHEHPTAHLVVELIERFDRTRFEMFGVALHSGPETDIRRRIREAFEHFEDAGARSDSEVVDWLRKNEIDIAVDLAGHAGGNRPAILAARPAPLIVNYAGHPGTLGADWADYILADPVVVPPGGEAHFSESVVRLPNCYLPSDTRFAVAPTPIRAAAGLPEEGFVFCSFNHAYKITPEIFDIWMRLLQQTAGSVLWLLVEDATARRHLRTEAEARGVAAGRLVFADRLPREDYLARLALADCFLDTLPCNAHTTASDALWMGLPLVTCLGNSFAARVAGSMLRAAGLEELITRDLAAYEATALALARTPERLNALRRKLAESRTSQPLFDMARLARHIERAFETMSQRHLQGLAPAGFDVPAHEP